MTNQPPAPDPDASPSTPGERRLDRPPSDRYRDAGEAGRPAGHAGSTAADPSVAPSPTRDDRPSPARGVAFGALAAILGAVALALAGGAFAISAGLLVVAAVLGYSVGLVTVIGAADTVAPPTRRWIAAALAGIGTALGQVGLWLFARAEGGVLTPIDYLAQTFGPLVPIEVLLAVAVAWWRAR